MDSSNDKEEVNREANFDILGVNALQQAAKKARKGDVLGAQVYAKGQNRFIREEARKNNATESYNNYFHAQSANYNMMQQDNLTQAKVQSFVPHAQMQMAAPQMARRMNGQQSDAMSSNMYSQMNMNSAAFKKKSKK